MAIQSINPYLILGGRTDDALAFYHDALGAEVIALNRFGDVDGSCPEAMRERVMHAELQLGAARIMLSDGPADAPTAGGAVSIAVRFDDAAQIRRGFERLSVDGTVIQPLFDSPWGTLFGVVVDRFGVSWMLDCTKT
ncbi:MAG TPA: VOC family protein [Gemmatimonas sp.]|uniref:VOC family protein n=1 Tax=Gemmatimonas sp. TaxID=1962908 RepID=UPI002ED799DB